jgi:hypothetical protein
VTAWWHLLAPRHRALAAFRLSPAVLRAWHLEALMLDLDNTLVAWGAHTPPDPVVRWMTELRASGTPLCLVSNSLSSRARAAAAFLELPFAEGRMKPSAAKLRHALQILGTRPDRTAMVGDQLFTDILAGNRLGVPTVLTEPLFPREPMRFHLIRAVERRLLAALSRRGLAPGAPEV